jgi:MFS transporter, FHS family, L-fucose permease
VYKTVQAHSVQGPYIGLTLVLLIVAGVIAKSQLPSIEEVSDQSVSSSGDRSSAWKYRHLVLGALGIFCYVGAEVAIGTYLINFIGLPEISGLPEADAAKYVSFYWGGAMVGRFLGSWIMSKIQPTRVLAFNAFCAAILVCAAIVLGGPLAMYAVLAVGLFNSVMFPVIFSLAIRGLGKNTAQGSGILCMAIVGGALIPLLQGRLADAFGLHHSYVLPIICYGYIAYYGLRGATAD